ncbi:MAG: DNA primase [Gammaproteobacteria bacterium]
MNIPREFIDLLITKIDIVDLINIHIPLRKKSGSNYFARCPFHQEKSGSFSVSQTKQFYYCFGCGAHGNAIDFIIQHEHQSFPEAVETLARQAGMEVPRSADAPKKDESLPALYELMNQTTTYYYEQMRASTRAIDYLKNRGISGKIAQQFSLGYAQTGWSHLLDQFGKTDADKKKLLDTGLIIKKNEGGYYDRFRDRIMFPIHDYRGRIIGFGGRILDQGEPKYLNSPETPLFQKGHELYGLHQALKSNRQLERVLIVEGYMDVIALFQHDITYAVATLGTATTAHHFQRLFRYTTDIVFCFDGDEAGRTAAWRALQVIFPLMNQSLQVRFLFLPDGEDPDSLVRKEGKVEFENRLNTAPALSSFFFQTLSKQEDLGTIEGRARFATSALTFIKQIPEGIFQGILVEELSKRARVDLAELKRQVKSGSTVVATPATKPASSEITIKLPAFLRLAIALIIQHPALASKIPDELPQHDLPGYGFFQELIRLIKHQPNITTGSLLEHFRGQKEGEFVAKLAQWDTMVPETGIENEFLGTIKQLETLNLDETIKQLLAKAGDGSLTDAEKLSLSSLIARKKSLV